MTDELALRDEHGRLLKPLPGAAPPITTVTARSMVQKRVEKYRQEAVKRITGEIASIDPGVSTGAAAFGVIAAKQAVALMDSEKPRIADLEKLGQIMTGQSAENSRRENAAPPPGALLASPSALVELVALIEQQQRRAVDAARADDATIRIETGAE
jgi:hypothetical protein